MSLPVTPLRKDMLGVEIKVKESFGKFLGGFAKRLRGAEREAEDEVQRGGGRPPASSEEEEALYEAMGWNSADEDNAGAVAREKLSEAIKR
jgi:hypothetical protein